MHNIKISHIADMHLDSTFSSLPVQKANIRRKEYNYTCLNAIKESADCDIIVLSGDIFDSGDASISVAESFLSVIKELKNTQVFYSCGNHDSYYTDVVKYCINNSPQNLHIFAPDKISCYTIEAIKTRVYGVSFANEHQYDSLLKTMPKCDDEYINILSIHADETSDKYNPIVLSDLKNYNLDYVALGHIHNYDGIKKQNNCYYAYSGILEGRGFDECGEKGYIKGVLSKDNCVFEFCKHGKRQYIDEIIDITDFKSEYDLIDVVNSICISSENICRFTFVGVNNFGKQIDVDFIASQCHCFYCVCTDNTKISSSVNEYTGYPGLMGACAAETKRLLEQSDNDAEKEKIKKSFELLVNIFDKR